MAIMRDTMVTALRRLDEQYQYAREAMFSRGENTPERVHDIERMYQTKLEEIRKGYDMNNDIYGQQILDPRQLYGINSSAMNAGLAAQNQPAQGSMGALAQQGTQVKPITEKEGVLFFRGGVLPEKWMGAHYDSYQRAVVGKQWKISYSSPYSSDTIMLWLSSEQFSGQDADKVARTYLETINQRRLG